MTIKTTVLLIVTGIGMLVIGCSSARKPYEAPPGPGSGLALVYIIRSPDDLDNRWPIMFTVNDRNAVSLHERNYSWVYLPAGNFGLTAIAYGGLKMRFAMGVKAGNTYYVEYKREMNSVRRSTMFMHALQPEEGLKLAKNYLYVEANQDFTNPNPTPAAPVDIVETNSQPNLLTPVPEPSLAGVRSKQDYVEYIAALTLSKICNDQTMLEKIPLPSAGCPELLKQYFPLCNQEMDSELYKWRNRYTDYSDSKKLHAEEQVRVYKYCLVEHFRTNASGQASK